MRKEQATTNTINMGDYTSTSSCTAYQTTAIHHLETCPHRLPCGYCRLLMQYCPNNKNIDIKVTW